MTDIFGFDERKIADGALASLRSAIALIKSPRCREIMMKDPVHRDAITAEADDLLEFMLEFNRAIRNAEQHLFLWQQMEGL